MLLLDKQRARDTETERERVLTSGLSPERERERGCQSVLRSILSITGPVLMVHSAESVSLIHPAARSLSSPPSTTALTQRREREARGERVEEREEVEERVGSTTGLL